MPCTENVRILIGKGEEEVLQGQLAGWAMRWSSKISLGLLVDDTYSRASSAYQKPSSWAVSHVFCAVFVGGEWELITCYYLRAAAMKWESHRQADFGDFQVILVCWCSYNKTSGLDHCHKEHSFYSSWVWEV
jgi:hypothetical protein